MCLAGAALLLGGAPRAAAYTLDWDVLDWTPSGARTNTFSNVDGSGVDVRITMTGDVSFFATSYPDDAMTNGTAPDNRRALWTRIDSYQNTNQSITVTVEFFANGTETPTNLLLTSIPILDMDSNNSTGNKYRDQIRNIGGTGTNGAAFSILPSASYVTNAANATFVIDNTSAASTMTANWPAEDSPQAPAANFWTGDAILSFGANPINSFRYSYGNAPGPFTGAEDPTLQFTALGDISFIGVPEPGALAALALAGGLLLWLRRRVR